MEQPEPEAAVRDAIRHWSRMSELVEFAARRHGFGDTDGGFGVTYPDDLDDYDRASGAHVPAGFVRAYGFWGPPDGYEVLVPEPEYLDALAAVLAEGGQAADAARVRSLADGQRRAGSSSDPDRGIRPDS